MRNLLTYLSIFLLFSINLSAQSRKIAGKVISEEFEILNGAVIQTKDSTVLGRADNEGLFQIDLPDNTNQIQIWFVGMESETLNLKGNCNYLEIILLDDFHVEYEIKRYNKRRKKLPELYKKAWKKGIFQSKTPCR